MTRTLSLAVRCLYLCMLGCLLVPFALQADEVNDIPTSYLPNDTLFFVLADCQSEIEICIEDLSLVELSNLSISVNGAAYQGSFEGCNLDTTSAYTYSTLFGAGESGPYELLVWRVGDAVFSGVFNTIPDLVDSMNLWDPLGSWVLDETTQFIAGGQSGVSYSDMAVQVLSINLPSFIGYNFGVEANGVQLSFGEGIHRVTIEDTVNNTIRKAVLVVACPAQTIIKQRVLPNETKTHCLDFSGLLTDVQTVAFCDMSIQDNVLFELMNEDSCVYFTGLEIGFDTACILACDAFGYCDTTLIITETYEVSHFREATINLQVGATQSFCLDTSTLAAPIEAFVNSCEIKSGVAAQISVDTIAYCASIEGLQIGQDTACLVFCNKFGSCDTTILYVNVHLAPTVSTINVTMTLGDSLDI